MEDREGREWRERKLSVSGSFSSGSLSLSFLSQGGKGREIDPGNDRRRDRKGSLGEGGECGFHKLGVQDFAVLESIANLDVQDEMNSMNSINSMK